VRPLTEASRRPYILDVFSRYIVGWTVQQHENAELATALIEQATEQQQITPGSSRCTPIAARRCAPSCSRSCSKISA